LPAEVATVRAFVVHSLTVREPSTALYGSSRGPGTYPDPLAPASGPLGTAPASVFGSSPTAGASAPAAPLTAPPSPTAAVEATLRLAHSQAFSRARLSLKPAELGGVEIVLHRGAGGVAAAVVAETPEAARLLEASGEDLRRRLEAQGVELSVFSVSVAADDSAPGRDGMPGTTSPTGRARGNDFGGDGAPGAQPAQTIDLGGGVLVDVLA
jgi:hypothetical protein